MHRTIVGHTYSDFGDVLTRLNGGQFPTNEADMKAALIQAYEKVQEYKLPPLWEKHKTPRGEEKKRFHLSGILHGRRFRVRPFIELYTTGCILHVSCNP